MTKLLNKHNKYHWSEFREQGSYWGMLFILWCYRSFGTKVISLLLYPIISYFFVTNRSTRQFSRRFLQRVYLFSKDHNIDGYFKKRPTLFDSFLHLLNFGHAIVDRFGGFEGKIRRDDFYLSQRKQLLELSEKKIGCVILTSHLGSVEIMRVMLADVPHVKMNVLAFTDHVEKFDSLTNKLGNTDNVELIPISTLNPGTAMSLKEKIDAGEFIVVASDRTSPTASGRVTQSLFLGDKAPFPQGSFILASLMASPVYLLFCIKENHQHTLYFEKFTDQVVLPRKQRSEKLQYYVDRYAQRLQHYCCKAPLQWFNFYDFWHHE